MTKASGFTYLKVGLALALMAGGSIIKFQQAINCFGCYLIWL